MNKTLDLFLDMFFPQRCLFCGKVCILPDRQLCKKCEEQIVLFEEPICPKCGREKTRCSCRKEDTVYYKEVRAAYHYETSIRAALIRWKFRGKLDATEIFIREMLETYENEIKDGLFDIVTFIPASKRTIKERGFNQTELLARIFSVYSGIECRDWITRSFDGEVQHRLSRYERLGNALGAFEVTDPGEVYGKTVLLIDDIKTTGSILNECAKMLMIAGAEDVYCLAVALG